ncbi:uncharacterized protein LOC127500068 isoform X2 [Ctenopharyngodon idella]|nr:uncharacterized protein LOC127500068 isoform X2 [Ctenopharyngodon idella]
MKIFNVTVIGVVVEMDGVKSVSVTEGDSVILQSDVSEVQRDVLIVWRFGDKGILLAKIDVENKETSLNDADGRFRDRLKLDLNGSLTIKNARTTDSGLYELQVRGRESSQQFHLSVNAVPDPGLSPGLIAFVVAALLVAAVVSSVVVYYRRKISELEKKVETIEEKKVADGDSATLETKTDLQEDDKVQWWYQDDGNLIAEISRVGVTREVTHDGFDERFRSKLVLNDKTGSLTINNTMNIHSGLYMLQISSKTRRIKKKFILTVTMRTVSVRKGNSVTLKTDIEIKSEDEILWTFGAENCLVVKAYSGMTIGKKFLDRVELDQTNGSLTITNMTNTDSGHFKLQIINSKHTTFRRFKVIVKGSTGEQLNDSMTEETGLLM